MSIHYTLLEFEPTIFKLQVSSHNHYTGSCLKYSLIYKIVGATEIWRLNLCTGSKVHVEFYLTNSTINIKQNPSILKLLWLTQVSEGCQD